jgi:hypothetical protein
MRSSRWRAVGSLDGDRPRLMRSGGAAGKGQQRDVARALDGHAEPALVARADAGHASRQDLAALLHKLRKDVGALIVDEVHLLDAKLADFLLAKILALAARAPTRAAGTARAPFATSTSAAMTAAVAPGTAVAAAFAALRRSTTWATWCRCWRLFLFL